MNGVFIIRRPNQRLGLILLITTTWQSMTITPALLRVWNLVQMESMFFFLFRIKISYCYFNNIILKYSITFRFLFTSGADGNIFSYMINFTEPLLPPLLPPTVEVPVSMKT